MWSRPAVELPPLPPTPSDDAGQARAAQRASTARFLEDIYQGPEVRRIVSSMKVSRVRNGYSEMIEDAMSRRHGTLGG